MTIEESTSPEDEECYTTGTQLSKSPTSSPMAESKGSIEFETGSWKRTVSRHWTWIALVELLVDMGFIFMARQSFSYGVARTVAFVSAASLLVTLVASFSVPPGPINLLLLVLLTVSKGLCTGSLSSLYEWESVLLAGSICTTVYFALTVLFVGYKSGSFFWPATVLFLLFYIAFFTSGIRVSCHLATLSFIYSVLLVLRWGSFFALRRQSGWPFSRVPTKSVFVIASDGYISV